MIYIRTLLTLPLRITDKFFWCKKMAGRIEYPEEIKERACALYIELGQVASVYRKLLEEFSDKYERMPKEVTVRNWINNSKLSEVRDGIYVDTIRDARAKELEENIARREKHKDYYQQVSEKAGEFLWGAQARPFRDGLDATRALDIGIQGERKIINEQINLKFVEDIFNVINSVIDNEDMLREIGLQLRKVLIRYNE